MKRDPAKQSFTFHVQQRSNYRDMCSFCVIITEISIETLFFVMAQIGITEFTSIAQAIQAIITSIAVFVAGYWTYKIFIQKRQNYPRANISHSITTIRIGLGKILIRVHTTITNKGDVLLRIKEGDIQVQQVLPLPPDIKLSIEQDAQLVKQDETEILWPCIEIKKNAWNCIEIEPGETDDVQYDFIIDSNVQVIIIYNYFKNASKQGLVRRILRRPRDIGWGATTLYHIPEEVNMGDGDKDVKKIVIPEDTKQQSRKSLPPPVNTKPASQEKTPSIGDKKTVAEQQERKTEPPKLQQSTPSEKKSTDTKPMNDNKK